MNGTGENNPYKDARSHLVGSIRSEFVGPSSGNDVLTENPVRRYSTGMLFPVNYEGRNDEPPTQDQKLDVENDPVTTVDDADIENFTTGLANSFFPSVLGISFYSEGNNPELVVQAKWTTYSQIDPAQSFVEVGRLPDTLLQIDEFKDNFVVREGKLSVIAEDVSFDLAKTISEKAGDGNFKSMLEVAIARFRSNSVWINSCKQKDIAITPEFTKSGITGGLELFCNRRHSKNTNTTLYTLAIKNTYPACPGGMDEEHVFFNVSLGILPLGDKKDIFIEYPTPPLFNSDQEEQSLSLLYRDRKTYAVGHGCSADWKRYPPAQNAHEVFTQSLPMYEVPQLDFNIPGLNHEILSMKFLSGGGGSSNKEIVQNLKSFCDLYNSWINKISNTVLPAEMQKAASRHIGLCKEANNRLEEGINILSQNSMAMESFKLANKAMFMQSVQSETQKAAGGTPVEFLDFNSKKAGEVMSKAGKGEWRPFQLGFILLSIKGIVDPESPDRNIVDLIWFPTGGGKTEAYLGLSAFTIFYRRLRYRDAGTAIMMRYTLRLLTAQQFQRACTLICAMEILRRQSPEKLGTSEISIGLWVGSESTPNTHDGEDGAKKRFDEFNTGASDEIPSPLLSCPWCGTKMLVEESSGRRHYAYKPKSRPQRATLYCFERNCAFKDRLPVLIVDEEIYEFPPTLLFGTVDKFAQMPMQKGVSRLFSADPDNPNLPPELVIQDELHLISGALGTLVGIYETAIDYLCSIKGLRPKVIASTATVRRASDQCKNLFNRETRQFPPSGIDIDDSFFSRETPTGIKPGRLYIGLMPSGKTQTTASIRLAASLLHAVFTMPAEEQVKDKYWTLVSYFNSIRELGGFISLLYDDIPLYANALKQRYGGAMRHIAVERELTSRKGAKDIPEILEQLSVSYPDRKAIDVLSATNMISVGIDIDRLGLMIIRGQPKLTSEYIQVSSRIGRKYPGIIATLYNSARTRDRAHYERFRTYHESFYRNVEPSSVTPFSAPARTRALSAVLITLFRHGLGTSEYNGEDGASKFDPGMQSLSRLKKYIFDRIKNVDPDEALPAVEDFDRLVQEWNVYVKSHSDKVVYKNVKQGAPIAKAGRTGEGLWIIPTSMRNVDVDCNVDIRDE